MNQALELVRARQVIQDRGRSIREAAGLSLREAAEAVDSSESALSLWERGISRPRGPAARRYFELLQSLEEGGIRDAG